MTFSTELRNSEKSFSTGLINSERSLDELLNESKLPAKIIVEIKQDLLKAIGTFLQNLNKKLKLPTRFVKSPELHTIIVSCASAALKMNDTSSRFGKKTKRKRGSSKKKNTKHKGGSGQIVRRSRRTAISIIGTNPEIQAIIRETVKDEVERIGSDNNGWLWGFLNYPTKRVVELTTLGVVKVYNRWGRLVTYIMLFSLISIMLYFTYTTGTYLQEDYAELTKMGGQLQTTKKIFDNVVNKQIPENSGNVIGSMLTGLFASNSRALVTAELKNANNEINLYMGQINLQHQKLHSHGYTFSVCSIVLAYFVFLCTQIPGKRDSASLLNLNNSNTPQIRGRSRSAVRAITDRTSRGSFSSNSN